MKISITYLYTIFNYGYPPSVEADFRALADIEKLGFHYLEMESLGSEHGNAVYQRRKEFKKALEAHNIHIHNYCGVDPDLVSLDDAKRHHAYEGFKRTAELAAELGAETLHLASYAPPVKYLGHAPYQLGESYSFGDVFRTYIPDDFCWEHLWETLVESCQNVAATARQFDKIIIMEPRVGEVICSVDSMLRLISDVNMPNFKANFDTAHFSAQRENVPLALAKLEGKYANIHIADNNPENTEHLPLGEGIIDFPEFFRLLKKQNYSGYLGLDLGGSPRLAGNLISSRDRIIEICRCLDIPVEY